MATTEQSNEPRRDYSSPATWGDLEGLRHSLSSQIERLAAEMRTRFAEQDAKLEIRLAEQDAKLETRFTEQDAKRFAEQDVKMAAMETRLVRWCVGTTGVGVAILGSLIGILEALR